MCSTAINSNTIFRLKHLFISIFFAAFFGPCAFAVERPGLELQEVGLISMLGESVDKELEFVNKKGEVHTLGSFFEPGRPVILVPVYYSCPRMCGLVMDGVSKLLEELSLKIGQDFRVVLFSFKPEEGPELAAKRENFYREKLKLGDSNGLDFLLDREGSSQKLLNQIGFQVKRDGKDYSHTAALFVMSPEGVVSQVYTGIHFSPWDIKLALVEASMGGVGSALDHVLLFCFRYDPLKGKYTWAVTGLLRAGGGITLILLSGLVVTMLRRERYRKDI